MWYRLTTENLAGIARKMSIGMVLIAAVSIGAPVYAETITHNFSGTITTTQPLPVAGVEVGTAFVGSFTYDSMLTEQVIVVDRLSRYSPATIEVEFTSPSNIQSILTFNNAEISVVDNFANDGFLLQAGSAIARPFSFNGVEVRFLQVTLIDTTNVVYSDTALPAELSLTNFNSTSFGFSLTLDGNSVDFGSAGQIETLDVLTAQALTCVGFQPPMANFPVKAKKNRAFPIKLELFDVGGFEQTDVELIAPPVVQVMFTASAGGAAFDVSDDALSSGQGSDGNQFVFTDDDIWQFNLKSTNYTAEGEYLVTAISGDESEYIIDPACVTIFVID